MPFWAEFQALADPPDGISTLQAGAPSDVSWFISPMNIDYIDVS
jgi:hypothetical protein